MHSNLRLALVDQIYRRKASDKRSWINDVRSLYEAKVEHPTWDAIIDDREDEPRPELEAVLRGLPISDAELASITQLTLDGDRDAYAWCYPYWWDLEPDHFQIHDLSGIEACTGLTYLSLGQGVVEAASLAPLARLPALKTLTLCRLCRHTEIEAVLDIPSLEELEIFNLGHDPAWTRVIASLQARGVKAGSP